MLKVLTTEKAIILSLGLSEDKITVRVGLRVDITLSQLNGRSKGIQYWLALMVYAVSIEPLLRYPLNYSASISGSSPSELTESL
jgi:single-stranded DNA-specific DHH superfamily exonuclease